MVAQQQQLVVVDVLGQPRSLVLVERNALVLVDAMPLIEPLRML